MNYHTLTQQHQYLSLNGHCLNIKQKTNLTTSLVLLKQEGRFNQVLFWGRIKGIKNDYHIAQGFAKSILDERVLFYSLDDGLTWKQLTKYDEKFDGYLDQIRGYFIGDPAHYYVFEKIKSKEEIEMEKQKRIEEEKRKKMEEKKKKGEEEGENEEEEEEEGEKEKNKASNKIKETEIIKITEEVRLTYIIHAIDHSTSVVPRGSHILKTNGIVEPNSIFQGLDYFSASKLEYYVHLRKSSDEFDKDNISLDKSVDFCDSIDTDIPNKCWSLQYDDCKGLMFGKSLIWPGYVFYHIPKTNMYGSFYIGNGQKNLDLCFML